MQDNKSIKIFLNIFPLSFLKPSKNPGLLQADDIGLLFHSLLSEVDLKLFLLKVPPACFILHFIAFYYTGLLITQNLIKKRHSHVWNRASCHSSPPDHIRYVQNYPKLFLAQFRDLCIHLNHKTLPSHWVFSKSVNPVNFPLTTNRQMKYFHWILGYSVHKRFNMCKLTWKSRVIYC